MFRDGGLQACERRATPFAHYCENYYRAKWIDICAQPRRCRANRSDVEPRSTRRTQWLSQHASAGRDARAIGNFSDRAIRSEQGNRADGAGFAIDAVRVCRSYESDASRPRGERAFSGLDIFVRHGHAGVVQRAPLATGTGKDDSRCRFPRSRFCHETHRCSRTQHGRPERAHIGQLKRRKVVERVVRGAAAAIEG